MKLKFIPNNIEVDVDLIKMCLKLAEILVFAFNPPAMECVTVGIAGVFIKKGEANLFLPTAKELKLIGQGHYVDQRRLACQLYCFGDVVVDLCEQEERANQGKLSQHFLKRTQKKSPGEARSKNDILIKDDEDIKQIKQNRSI